MENLILISKIALFLSLFPLAFFLWNCFCRFMHFMLGEEAPKKVVILYKNEEIVEKNNPSPRDIKVQEWQKREDMKKSTYGWSLKEKIVFNFIKYSFLSMSVGLYYLGFGWCAWNTFIIYMFLTDWAWEPLFHWNRSS